MSASPCPRAAACRRRGDQIFENGRAVSSGLQMLSLQRDATWRPQVIPMAIERARNSKPNAWLSTPRQDVSLRNSGRVGYAAPTRERFPQSLSHADVAISPVATTGAPIGRQSRVTSSRRCAASLNGLSKRTCCVPNLAPLCHLSDDPSVTDDAGSPGSQRAA
jgi:hypothetical protein